MSIAPGLSLSPSLSLSLSFSIPYSLFLSRTLPDIGASEQFHEGPPGREGMSDALGERERGGAVVPAAGLAGAPVVAAAGAGEEQPGARGAAGQAAGEGQWRR